MTGRDTRTPEQLREDIKLLNGIDLGEDPRLHLEMFIKGAGSGDVFNQRAAINPKLEAWNKLTSVITYDRFMSTTAQVLGYYFPGCHSLRRKFHHRFQSQNRYEFRESDS